MKYLSRYKFKHSGVCVCMYVRMYVCTYVCMYVRMYVCMYVCMYVGCSSICNITLLLLVLGGQTAS